MNYRADIVGLRGIAVLLVILFHAGVTLFPSGFVGVDVFFVISGFLISGVIQTAIVNNTFSFSQFYARRLWRLQPAMLTMLLLSLLVASIFYLPDDYADFLKSGRKVIQATANQYFAHETTGYAAPDADKMLLLHMWSLSIEWQWYLFFPVIYTVGARFLNKQKLFLVVSLFTLVAIAYSLFFGIKHPVQTYYAFLSRVFEFMLGVLAFEMSNKKNILKAQWQKIVTVVALIIIIFVATQNDILKAYPNYWTWAVAISSAVLLAWGAKEKDTLYTKLISSKPLVYTGEISYSLYLFHWPLLAALHYVGYESMPARALAVALAFTLASLTYFYIEMPYRRSKTPLLKSLLLLVIVPYLLVYSIYTIGKHNDQFSGLRFGSEMTRVNKTLAESRLKQREDCMNVNVEGTDAKCVVGDKTSTNSVLLMGDSHSNQYWNFFDRLAKDANLAVDIKSTSLCLALPGIYQYDFWNYPGMAYQQCHDNVNEYYKAIDSKKYKFVVISEVWENYASFNIYEHPDDKKSRDLSIERINKAAREGIKRIIASGATPVIVKSMAPMPAGFLTCFYEHFKTRRPYSANECNPHAQVNDAQWWTTKMFDSLQQAFPQLIIIDPKKVQCDGQRCETEIDGIPLYRDVGHLNDYATGIFAERYLKKMGNPLKNKY
ncbi:acyltransferase family protein [Pseudocitrobacter vendiensis]|uniref:Acyltransferase n=1 Tax=Pseudocitrobacter vendiensis TaxID=2488306 RepID=A0ABM9FC06_9ENTR|nr:acyltransferase family protein [Pseudocitrobacter vendiensis]CAH6660724.1 Acyltransferase [Pseudocitrobacter vendiensis]